ncbi:MAG: hypothetical protein HY562_12850 [Ignavibacteriales bacterium]|nr:hypothetical protein [Ignavibacteriales bacterium]
MQLGLQRALEAERDEIVGRSWHDHHDQEVSLPRRQYRNGYSESTLARLWLWSIAFVLFGIILVASLAQSKLQKQSAL